MTIAETITRSPTSKIPSTVFAKVSQAVWRSLAACACVGLTAILGVVTAPRPAWAHDQASTTPPRDGVDRWQASLGLRGTLIRDAGYDPFSSNDALVQSAMTVSAALRTGTGFVPVLGLALDLGGADDVARGVDSHLGLSRLAVVFEPRWVPAFGAASGLYIAGRLAPGVLRASASLRDPAAPAVLRTSYSSLSVDASVGAGVRLNSRGVPVGIWVVGDAGYGWAPRRHIALAPALPAGDAPKAGETSLGDLAARGPFMRLGLALSY
jgi:hypothetical protein